jgi:UDP-galactopyranose mutase
MKQYDYLVVGAGLFGSIFTYLATKKGKKCLVIDKRDHIGGNIYTKEIDGINVHYYGPHIFHTSNKKIWDFVNSIAPFNNFQYSPIANCNGELYNLPFNMNTFYRLWGVKAPQEAMAKIEEQKQRYSHIKEPRNLEEQALVFGGRDIYEKLIKGYSEKQWGRAATEIPAFIIQRLPFRFTFDNNYFNDLYQGIPVGGYTEIVQKMLNGVEIYLNTDFFKDRNKFLSMSKTIVYTGMIDEYFDNCYGNLEYRSLHFEHQIKKNINNYQGCAVFNYTDAETQYTRIIEHKHFEPNIEHQIPNTVITYEYPKEWSKGKEPYYPINDKANNNLYIRYKKLADKEKNIIFGGRLGQYKYYNMDEIIENAFSIFEKNQK